MELLFKTFLATGLLMLVSFYGALVLDAVGIVIWIP